MSVMSLTEETILKHNSLIKMSPVKSNIICAKTLQFANPVRIGLLTTISLHAHMPDWSFKEHKQGSNIQYHTIMMYTNTFPNVNGNLHFCEPYAHPERARRKCVCWSGQVYRDISISTTRDAGETD